MRKIVLSVKDKVKLLLKSRNVKNSGWIIGQQVLQMLLQFLVGIFSARYLGPSNYGILHYTASFVTFFVPITSLGMDSVIIKKIIECPQKEGVYVGSCMGLRLIASFLSIISVTIFVFVLNVDESLKVLIAAIQAVQLSFKAIQIIDSWFQRYLKSKYVSIAKMIACIVVSGYKIVLLVTEKNIIWFAVSCILTDAIIAVIELMFYYKNGGQKLRFSLACGKEVLGHSYHLIISGMMAAIYSQMDRVMIGQMLSEYDVGLYTTSSTICSIWLIVPTAAISSFQPMILELKQNGNQTVYMKSLKQLYNFVIWGCILCSCVIFIFAGTIIGILYGSEYMGAVSTLKIAVWFEVFAMIGTARNIWLLCENKLKYAKYYMIIGVVINLVLNFLLIPLKGINGAAIATLVTQIVTSIFAPLLFKDTRIHTKIVLESLIINKE